MSSGTADAACKVAGRPRRLCASPQQRAARRRTTGGPLFQPRARYRAPGPPAAGQSQIRPGR